MGENASFFVRNRRNLALAAGLVAAFIVLTLIMAQILPENTGVDWYESYRPAANELLAGRNPYLQWYHAPPWTLLPAIPLALLPPDLGRAAFVVLGLSVFAWTAFKLGARPLVLAAFILSPPVLHSLVNANTDWLALLGFVLPPQIGLLFVLVKPQIGIAVVLFWLVEAWRTGRVREIIRVFWPLTVVTALSFVIFGWWPQKWETVTDLWWNASLFPASIPVGLALVVASLRLRKLEYAMAASPCLSPYVLLHAWSGALAALLKSPWEFFAAWAGLWILVGIKVVALAAG